MTKLLFLHKVLISEKNMSAEYVLAHGYFLTGNRTTWVTLVMDTQKNCKLTIFVMTIYFPNVSGTEMVVILNDT